MDDVSDILNLLVGKLSVQRIHRQPSPAPPCPTDSDSHPSMSRLRGWNASSHGATCSECPLAVTSWG